MEFCPECGTKSSADSTICASCGLNFITDAKPAKSASSTIVNRKSNQSLTCSNCGEQNPEGTSFCGNCGYNMGNNDQTVTGSIFCGHCGKKNPYSGSFCNQCGQSLANQNQTSQPQGHNVGYQVRQTQQTRYQYQEPISSNQMLTSVPSNFKHPNLKSSALAVIISFLIPGFGYMYTGLIAKGIAIFIGIFILIFLPFVSIILYFYQIYRAHKLVEAHNLDVYAAEVRRRNGYGY